MCMYVCVYIYKYIYINPSSGSLVVLHRHMKLNSVKFKPREQADKLLLTSFRACRSDFGRFFDWLSASAHSFMI